MYTVKIVVMRTTKEKSTKCTLRLSDLLKSWQKADGAIEQWR
jgi:hypothetical protein